MEIERRLQQPVDATSLAVFRIGFGALMLVAVARFFVNGWIDDYFLEPTHFFKYWGFSWVRPWPAPLMYAHFALMGLCALGLMLGYRYRLSVVGFGLTFAYAHLIDKTNYLNHYYLVLCLCGLLVCLPLHASWSLDARRDVTLARPELPAWMLWTVRAQLGVVYFFGGVAKLKPDWLGSAQPLSIWLPRSSDLPLIGSWLTHEATARLMSWAGAAFDLAIVPLLLWRRTRALAYLAVLSFHLLTAQLFQLGLFPYLMIFGSLVFLPADYPRRAQRAFAHLGARAAQVVPGSRQLLAPTPRWVWAALAAHFALQLTLPLRHWLYPGNVCWTEQGYRFAWNVMLMEKNGSAEFRVVEPSTGRSFRVSPLAYFTRYQTKMMAPQPDMVLEAAHIVADDFRRRGVKDPAVYVDAFASLNGRRMQRLIDPRVDLAREVDGISNKSWILPMNTDAEARPIARSYP